MEEITIRIEEEGMTQEEGVISEDTIEMNRESLIRAFSNDMRSLSRKRNESNTGRRSVSRNDRERRKSPSGGSKGTYKNALDACVSHAYK